MGRITFESVFSLRAQRSFSRLPVPRLVGHVREFSWIWGPSENHGGCKLFGFAPTMGMGRYLLTTLSPVDLWDSEWEMWGVGDVLLELVQ